MTSAGLNGHSGALVSDWFCWFQTRFSGFKLVWLVSAFDVLGFSLVFWFQTGFCGFSQAGAAVSACFWVSEWFFWFHPGFSGFSRCFWISAYTCVL
jgi:hypothetical protein